MTKTASLVIVCLMAAMGIAQAPAASTTNEMQRLSFLVGQWKGDGWIQLGPGQRSTFHETETIQYKADGALLLIDGLGKGKPQGKDEEVTVHTAFTVVSYDSKARAFRWLAYSAERGGNWIDTQAAVQEHTLLWGFQPEHGPQIRFTIQINDKGQWFETGEYSMDRKNWSKFFEMTLDRVS